MKDRLIAGEFSEAYPPLMDGVGQVVEHYSDILRNDFGYDVRVITTIKEGVSVPDEENILRAVMHPLKPLGPYGYITVPKAIRKKILEIDYDIIHTHSPFTLGALGRKIARKRGIPHVTTFHTQFRQDIEGVTHSRLLAGIVTSFLVKHYNKADAVLAPNKRSADVLRFYGYKGEITIVENATEMRIPSEDEKAELRKKALSLVDIDQGKPVLLYIGQHKDEKNIPLMIESLRLLKDKASFNMIFVGDGSQRQNYERKVKEYGIENTIFFGETRDRGVIAALYAIADIFLFPSMYDTSSLTLRESSAFAVPCVLVESVTSEEFTDGFNGYIAQNDPVSYADSIFRAINDPGRKEIGENARRTIYKTFQDSVRKLDQIYQSLLIDRKA